jgi:uncharacterized protein (DUF983 family)
MKTCPFCAEADLKDAAVVCKHCGRNMPLAARERRIIAGVLVLLAAIVVFGAVEVAHQLSNPNATFVVGEPAGYP